MIDSPMLGKHPFDEFVSLCSCEAFCFVYPPWSLSHESSIAISSRHRSWMDGYTKNSRKLHTRSGTLPDHMFVHIYARGV